MFTFIVPSIRKGSLEYAVDSIINQSYPNWNAIICGDGTAIPAFEDDRILSIIAPHRGSATETRRYAAKYATEEWLVFLDDDDWVIPNYLETFLPLLDSSDVIVSTMDNYGTPMPTTNELIHGNVGISFAVKTEIFRKYPMPPPPSEDYWYLKQLKDMGFKIEFTNVVGYIVRKYLGDPNYAPTC